MAILDAPTATMDVGGASLFGMPMKHVSLITLTFQNSALILIMHYSRMMPPEGDHRYFTSTAVFLTEVIKLAIALTFSLYEVSRSLAPSTPATVLFEQIYNQVFSGDGWKLAIPATLYTLQNTLQYVAISNLDPIHFQILYQLKILTTALFTVTMLGRTLSPRRWASLVILTVGVSIVSIPSSGSSYSSDFVVHDMTDHFFPRSVHELGQSTNGVADVARELTKRAIEGFSEGITGLVKRSATYEGIEEDLNTAPIMSYSLGLTSVLTAAAVSGLTGVYFEKVLKDSTSPVSVWTRNIQLSFYSLFPALIVGIFFKDGADIAKHGFFDGYNWVVWTLIVLQAFGGILASLCINYADNIAKNFATSISIVVSFLFSVWFFHVSVTLTFFIGTSLVLAATLLYNSSDRKRSRPPPINLAGYEKTTIDPLNTPRIGCDDGRLSVPNALHTGSGNNFGLSTSRPSSPLLHHVRNPSTREKNRDE